MIRRSVLVNWVAFPGDNLRLCIAGFVVTEFLRMT